MPLLFLAINKLKYDDATSLQNKTRQDKTDFKRANLK
jgi:hypothetical protein